MIFDRLKISCSNQNILFPIIGKVIEAVDLSSLLEKFEEMEKLAPLPNLRNKPTVKDIPSHRAKSTKKMQSRPIKQRSYQDNMSKKSLVRTSNQHKVNSDSSQEPVEMTKVNISINGVLLYNEKVNIDFSLYLFNLTLDSRV